MKYLLKNIVVMLFANSSIAQFSDFQITIQNAILSIQQLNKNATNGYIVSLPDNSINEFLLYAIRKPIIKVPFEFIVDTNGLIVEKHQDILDKSVVFNTYEVNNFDAAEGIYLYYNYPFSIYGQIPTNQFKINNGIYILEFYSNNKFIESNFIKVEQNILTKL